MSFFLRSKPTSQLLKQKNNEGDTQANQDDKKCTFNVFQSKLHQVATVTAFRFRNNSLFAGPLAVLLPLGQQSRLGNRANLFVDYRQQVVELPEHHRGRINDHVIRNGKAEKVFVLIELKWVAQCVGARYCKRLCAIFYDLVEALIQVGTNLMIAQ